MNRSKYYLTLLISLLLLCLCSCTKSPESPASVHPNPDTPNQEKNDTIHLALPLGTAATICSRISSAEMEIVVSPPTSTTDAKTALLEGSVDFALLSPQSAAELYRNGKNVQVVAVVSSDDELLDSMGCLVGRTDYLKENGVLVAKFLSAYADTIQKDKINDAIFFTGWDMLDLVQQSLEAQFELQPDPNHSIPDGNFYYIPT